jgi:hypothetical protein
MMFLTFDHLSQGELSIHIAATRTYEARIANLKDQVVWIWSVYVTALLRLTERRRTRIIIIHLNLVVFEGSRVICDCVMVGRSREPSQGMMSYQQR